MFFKLKNQFLTFVRLPPVCPRQSGRLQGKLHFFQIFDAKNRAIHQKRKLTLVRLNSV